ncbi:MAG: hypothetical protein CL927_04090 [Deltaproteobacteria bacterium]|mgnify:CR=1 FL=1|nr:hypothetical protein [Deltaproteobacteria bacterium]HCH64559.1 hypothetical protein [Deltaproteobacteria bacterium]
MRSIALILPMSVVFLATGCGNDAKNQDSNGSNSEEEVYTPAAPNAVPQASFTSHRAGDTEREGYAFIVEGTVFDADNAPGELDVFITADGEDVCSDLAVDEDGKVSCEIMPSEGMLNLQLRVVDPEGDAADATVSITVNPTDAPVAAIDLPSDGNNQYYTDIAINIAGSIGDTETAVADLEYSLESDIDADLDFGIEIDADGNLTGSAMLSEGIHTLTLKVIDETGKVGQDSVQFEVGPENQNPICTIVGPTEGTSTISGEVTNLDADVSDPDIGPDRVQVRWESDIDGVLSEGLASDASVTDFDVELTDGLHNLTVTAVDETGATCAASVSHVVGSAPMVAFNSPADGDIINEGSDIVFSVTVGDAETAAEALSIVWTDASGEVLSNDPADSSGLATFTATDFEPGAHTVTITATDADGFTQSASIAITVNAAPSAPVVSLSPVGPTTSADLQAIIDVDSVDPEGGAVSYTYEWSVDGVVSSASTSDILPGSATQRGENWSVNVVPSDGMMAGAGGAANVTIANEAPVASAVAINPDPASVGDDLTCNPTGADADGDSLSWSYGWTVDGADAGEASNTLASGAFTKGQEVICTATPNDGFEDGAPVASAASSIGNSAPSIDSVAITPNPATSSNVLTCDVSASDADGDSLSYSYAWQVDGADAGVSTSTLNTASFSRNSVVSCTVSVSDDGVAFVSDTSIAITILNSAPDMDSVSISPAAPTVADDLTCIGSGSDNDGDSITYSYAWTVNGVASGSTATLASGSFAKGDIIACEVLGNDGFEDGGALQSDELVITNSSPQVDTITVLPGIARVSDDLECDVSISDADGDSYTTVFNWKVNGADMGITGSTLVAGSFNKSDVVTCEVEATDGDDSSGFVVSADNTIANTKPTVSSVALSPAAPSTDDDLTCNAVGADADGDAVSFSYEWTIDGVVAAETGNVLSSADFSKGQSITCKVTPNDGDEDGSWIISGAKTVVNSVPEITSIAINPTAPNAGENLTCTVAGTDADGDSVSYTYSWQKNGAPAGVTTQTLSSVSSARGDIFTCTAIPDDGADAGLDATSASVTIVNEAPVVDSVTLSTASPFTNDTLTANAMVSDGDGDSTTLSYEWYVDSAMVQSGADNTLSGAVSFDKGQSVHVIAKANDGSDDSAAVQSNTATVANTPPTAPVVLVDPEGAVTDDDLVCIIDTPSADADGDAINYAISWERDGAEWSGAVSDGANVGDTIDSADTSDGEEWVCTALPNDGDDDGASATDDETVLPSQVTFDILDADLLNQLSCDPSSDDRTSDGMAEWGFTWDDTSGRTPSAMTVDFGIGLACATGTFDVSLNGMVVDSITVNAMTCACTTSAGSETLYTFNPADLSAYDPTGQNELTIDAGLWAGLYPDGSGNYASVVIDY